MDTATSEHRGGTTRLGSFEILRKLARGGMAEILLARTSGPSGFEKLVVLKKILPRYAGKPRFVQLFLEEAKLAASLDHPNIAQVYDIGMDDGSYFFTMEYLHGQDVRSILHRTWRIGERFPIEHAVQIARHVASALHFAHEKQRGDGSLLGIVHRDVSPSNIIVTYDGATKLLDFGVAKTAASSIKTRTGLLKGKVSYMSPEQARGAPLDRRSDIFSLGIVLWEMVTTQRLYRADNDLATLQLIITRPARPPSAVRPECPAELERIVLRALALDPDARYQVAEQLVVDLDELAREHKLKQSSNALAATLGQLFGPELAAWREARAKGVPLADHLHEVGDMTTPISESDFVDARSVPGGSAADADLDDDDELDELDEVDELGEVDDEVNDEVDDEVDDELTEHAAPIPGLMSPAAAALSPLAAAPILPEPTAVSVLSDEPSTSPDGPPLADLPTQTGLGPADTLIERSAVPRVAVAEPRASSRPHATPPAPGIPVATLSDSRVLTVPFAAPPWRSGMPSLPSEPVARSWSVIDLPAFDPDAFKRQRRIALRVAAGLVGFVILLALLAGHC